MSIGPLVFAVGIIALILLGLAYVLIGGMSVGGPAALPYGAVSSLLTPAELRFYTALRQVVGARYLIMVKVRLADLVTIKASGRDWWRAFSVVGSKHADFVVTDPQTLVPLLVIELDDASHQRADRRERDGKVDGVLGAAGLPILHTPVRKTYDPAVLGEEIRIAWSHRRGTR